MKREKGDDARQAAWRCPWCGHAECEPRHGAAEGRDERSSEDEWLVLVCPRCTTSARDALEA